MSEICKECAHFQVNRRFCTKQKREIIFPEFYVCSEFGGKGMTDSGTDGTYNERKEATWGSGYVPHGCMERFKCPKCGSVYFKCYPQSAPADRSRTWTYEYVCAECGQGMGLTIKGDE